MLFDQAAGAASEQKDQGQRHVGAGEELGHGGADDVRQPETAKLGIVGASHPAAFGDRAIGRLEGVGHGDFSVAPHRALAVAFLVARSELLDGDFETLVDDHLQVLGVPVRKGFGFEQFRRR